MLLWREGRLPLRGQTMVIDILGVEKDRALRARAVKVVGAALEPIKLAPIRAKVTFFDDNGPKGGRGMRCAVDVPLPYRPAIRVEQVAETSRLALHEIGRAPVS